MAAEPADMEPSSVTTFSSVTLQITTNAQRVVTSVALKSPSTTYQIKTNGLPWDFARFQNRIVDLQGEISSISNQLWITIVGKVVINEKVEAQKREQAKKQEEARKLAEAKKKKEPQKKEPPKKAVPLKDKK